MSAQSRPSRLSVTAGIAGAAAALAALIVVAVATATPAHHTAIAKSHSCLVMTGSGDPAFVRNFNPYTATGLPSGAFVLGAIYEPLIISPEGGLPAVPWLARTWKW